MSWSLQIQNGDLAFGSNGFATVNGGQKLIQDLRCAVLEPAGDDPMHPTFGSVIDGGVDSNGITQSGVIGEPNDSASATFVGAEIQRVCRAYQSQQIARNSSDVSIYGKSTLTADEALLEIGQITVNQTTDHILITTQLQTGSGSLPLAIPFSTS